MNALKPCPFCGGEATENRDISNSIYCKKCFAEIDTDCVDWNTRPIEDELRARIAELEEAYIKAEDTLDDVLLGRAIEIGKLKKCIAELEAENDQLTADSTDERQDDKWIPVSERLPENWESVLTIDISKSTRDMVTAFYNPETSLWSTHFSCDLWVTHWIPLPEPPIVYGKECD